MLGNGRPPRPSPTDAHDPCGREGHAAGDQDEAADRAVDAVPRSSKPKSAHDERRRSHGAEHDVEGRLRHEPSAPVEDSDERRVEAVKQKHETAQAQRAHEVRRAHERRSPRSGGEKRRERRERERRMHDERPSHGRGLDPRVPPARRRD